MRVEFAVVIPDGFRILLKREIIIKGDLWTYPTIENHTNEWFNTQLIGNKVFANGGRFNQLTYIRKIVYV